jgi:hypothetical protein
MQTHSTTATFEFKSNELEVTFTCSLDDAPEVSCTSGVTFRNLAIGGHTFAVFATDQAGNDGEADTWSWIRQA